MLGAKELNAKFESDVAFSNNYDLLSENDLENVVGGLAVAYIFPYVKTADGRVAYKTTPL